MIEGEKLLEALPVAVYLTDAQGTITFFNEAAAKFWGRRPELGTEKWCGSAKLFWPDGRPLPLEETALATSLRRGEAVLGVEALLERPDGERVPFVPYPTLLRNAQGEVIGALNLVVDVAEKRRAQIDQERLAAIVSSSEDAIISKTLDGTITSWNQGAQRIFGYTSEEMLGAPITTIIPPESLAQEEQILAQLRRGERISHFECERVTKSGRLITVSVAVSPIKDPMGRVVGASKVARDVTERKHHEHIQTLLFDELNHRVKNMLAIIQSIASQSLTHSKSPNDFITSFNGRIKSMARAHDLVVARRMEGSDVRSLVSQQLHPDEYDDPRITIWGPDIELNPKLTVQLAMVLHELTSNARQHGALSVPDGRLSISWELLASAPNSLMMRWKEDGLAAVAAPRDRGFGSILIERSIDSHGGSAQVNYQAHGLEWTVSLPLEDSRTQGTRNTRMNGILLAPAARSGSGSQSLLKGTRVLIIEDEPLVTLDIEMHLTGAGCGVVGPAPSIDRAIRLIEMGEFDFALVDANLHGEQVEPVAEMLVERDIPFCFATGYGRDGLPEKFRAYPVLAKPFSGEQMLAQIAQILVARRTNAG